jgi:hypothetical protein
VPLRPHRGAVTVRNFRRRRHGRQAADRRMSSAFARSSG